MALVSFDIPQFVAGDIVIVDDKTATVMETHIGGGLTVRWPNGSLDFVHISFAVRANNAQPISVEEAKKPA